MAKTTSVDAYHKHEDSGGASTQRARITRYLNQRKTPATRREIEQALGIPINAVCGRVAELVKRGIATAAGTRKCRVTGNKVEGLRLLTESERAVARCQAPDYPGVVFDGEYLLATKDTPLHVLHRAAGRARLKTSQFINDPAVPSYRVKQPQAGGVIEKLEIRMPFPRRLIPKYCVRDWEAA